MENLNHSEFTKSVTQPSSVDKSKETILEALKKTINSSQNRIFKDNKNVTRKI